MEKKSQHMMKGMQKDMDPVYNAEGTYPFALNAVLGSRDGNSGAIVNEEGNEPCYQETEGILQIGSSALPNGDTVLFSTDNEYSYISRQDSCNCNVTLLIKSKCLNFKTYKQIDALTRVIRGCENVVYFTDNYNEYRSLNIDRLEDYLSNGFTTIDDANNDPDNGWNCRKISHFPSYNLPAIDINDVYNSGGNMKTGAYQFVIRYLDVNLNPTNWAIISNPVTIIEDSYTNSYDYIAGAKPYTLNDNNYTKKSVELKLSNLDLNYKYFQIGIIESSFGLNQPSINYYSTRQLLTSDVQYYLFTGFNEQDYVLTSLGDFNIDSLYVNTVEAHIQIDDRLLLSNVTTYEYDWATLQRCTLLTKTFWDKNFIELAAEEGTTQKDNPKFATVTFDNRTFISDEIYSFGIVYVFKNGLKSPVFHIPGRKANFDYSGADITAGSVINPTVTDLNSGHYRGSGVTNEWDTKLLTVVHDGYYTDPNTQVPVSMIEHIPSSEFVNCVQGPVTSPARHLSVSISGNDYTFNLAAGETMVVRIIDHTAITDTTHYLDSVNNVLTIIANNVEFLFQLSINNGLAGYVEVSGQTLYLLIGGIAFRESTYDKLGCQIERWKVYNTAVHLPGGNLLGYHETTNSTYNNVLNACLTTSIWDASGIGGENLNGQKIRHHRIPDLSMKGRLDDGSTIHYGLMGTKLIFDLTNVYANIPTEIKDELQGYFIVMGDRNEIDKTVLDKGYFFSNAVYTNLEVGSTSIYSDNNLHVQPPDTLFGPLSFVNGAAIGRRLLENDEPFAYAEFLSNKFLYESDIASGTYVKIDHYKHGYILPLADSVNTGAITDSHYRVYKTYDFRPSIGLPGGIGYSYGFPAPNHSPHKLIKTSFIVPYGIESAPVSQFGVGFTATSRRTAQPYGVVVTERKLQPSLNIQNPLFYPRALYGAIKIYRDVYNNLNSIKYVKTHSNMKYFTTLIPEVNEGDTFITTMRHVKTSGERTGSDNTTGIKAQVSYGIFSVESHINSALRHSNT